ncbi:MAG: S-layer homology domain-containing protein [Ruminococcaceae bacterium]|nr:S-layer homology domain-containing protein [Oscillospiraceae bacterium]
MLKTKKATALVLVVAMLLSMAAMTIAAPVTREANSDEKALAQQMVEKFEAYHEPFSADEKAEIKASYDALKAMTDAQWQTLIDATPFFTAEFIAKFNSEADAKAALLELMKDTYQIIYAVYDDDVLYDACLEFLVDQTNTIGRIYDRQVTKPMFVELVEDAEKTLAGLDISGSISDNASDYWNVVYGMGENYIDAVDNVVELAIDETIKNDVLKTKMDAIKWETKHFADLHEAIIDVVDADFRAMTVLYDSILREHSSLWNVADNEEVAEGKEYMLDIDDSVTFRFTIFGKNVSLPFGSYIKLPNDGSLVMATNQNDGTFTVTAKKEVAQYAMVVRRGVEGTDELVNTANIFKTFYITCEDSTTPGPSPTVTPTTTPTPTTKPSASPTTKPTHKVEFRGDDPKPTPTPELGAEITGGDAADDVEVTITEVEPNKKYHVDVMVNDDEQEDGESDEYEISVVIPTDYSDKKNLVLYYLDEEGNKVIVPSKTKNGVITATTNYIGDFYVEQTDVGMLTKEHVLYLVGDDQGLFRPNDNMTRAEVAQMFYNLLADKNVTGSERFEDVDENKWYAKAVNVLAAYKIVLGYEGYFRPDDAITRDEFTAIAVRFSDITDEGEISFVDVDKDRWSYSFILTAANKGWISGYEDNTFRPENPITRAEVTSIVNRMLNRVPDEAYIDANVNNLKIFPDNTDKEFWAYYQIVEATNTHDYTGSGESENWK